MHKCLSNSGYVQYTDRLNVELERRANKILKTETVSIKNEFDKQAVLLVRKCLDGDICVNFNDYFAINQHRMNTRNKNILVKTPKVKSRICKKLVFISWVQSYTTPSPRKLEKTILILKASKTVFYFLLFSLVINKG